MSSPPSPQNARRWKNEDTRGLCADGLGEGEAFLLLCHLGSWMNKF